MISQELEVSLHMAFVDARSSRHEFITVEHLLLALLDNAAALDVLKACDADIESLRENCVNSLTKIRQSYPEKKRWTPSRHWVSSG